LRGSVTVPDTLIGRPLSRSFETNLVLIGGIRRRRAGPPKRRDAVGNAWLRLICVVEVGPVFPYPRLNVVRVPHAAHGQHLIRLGEIAVTGDGVRTRTSDAESDADLRCAQSIMRIVHSQGRV
jgi:hypothetical protein